MFLDVESINRKVSVIIPIYNVEKYLTACLDSVINQTYKNIEIICIDDGSNYKTKKILKEYSNKDERIKLIFQQHRGISAARNVGIENSTGDYIVFMDSDDIMELNCVESAYKKIEQSNADIVIFINNVFSKNEIKTNDISYEIISHYKDNPILADDLARINSVVWDKMYKKDFLLAHNIRFAEEILMCEDVVFNFICACHSPKYVCLPEVLYNYRIHSKSMMSSGRNLIKFHIKAFEYFLKTREYNDSDKESKLIYIDNLLGTFFYYLNKKRYRLYHLLYNYQLSVFFKKLKTLVDNNILSKSRYYNKINNFFWGKYVLKSLFSIKNKSFSSDYKILKLFGLSFKIKISSYNLYRNFQKQIIKDKTVLVVEGNFCHGETLPGYIKYFYDLGYKVDVLCTNRISEENPFCILDKQYYQNIYTVSLDIMRKILSSDKIKQYDYVFFNSYYLYHNAKTRFMQIPITQFFNKITEPKHSIIVLEHHLDLLNPELCEKHRVLKLVKLGNVAVFCNSHFFGKFNITEKNDIVQFIVVGNIESSRKNFKLLFDALQRLISKNITNFRVILVGAKTIFLPDALTDYVSFTGRVPFDKMYEHVRQSDFLLALLDPNNKEHERYLKYGATGSMQLSYGFCKPIVIHDKYAKIYQLNDKNAIIYDDNFDKALEDCIKLSKDEYKNICENLYKTHIDIYQESLVNLRKVLEYNK